LFVVQIDDKAQVANAREEQQMGNENETQPDAYISHIARQTDAHDSAFVRALSAQADAFFGFDKIKAAVEDIEYLHIRTTISGRPIRDWRQYATIATVLAKGGMTAEDIIDEGMQVTFDLARKHYGSPESHAELVASIAATYGLTGERIQTIPATIDRVLETLR
jgi:hypothetical protein